MVSGSISLPSPGFFSPFPHGTGSLSVESVYLALGGGPPGFPQDSPCPVVLGNNSLKILFPFAYRTHHLLWSRLPPCSAKKEAFQWMFASIHWNYPTTPIVQRMQPFTHYGFRLFPVRSPLLRESLLFSFPLGTEMFHFPRFAS